MAENPTIIVAHLNDDELKKNIADLVATVKRGTHAMENDFNAVVQNMVAQLQALGSMTFTPVVKPIISGGGSGGSGGSGSGAGGGGGTPPAGSVAELREQIKLQEKKREQMQLTDPLLRGENEAISQQRTKLKEVLMTTEQLNESHEKLRKKQEKIAQAPLRKEFNIANTMSTKDLTSAEAKLRELERIQQRMRTSGLFDTEQMNKVQLAIDRTQKKIETLRKTKPMTMKDILNLPENSIDAIAKKMSALKKLPIDPNNKNEVAKLRAELERLKTKQDEILGRNAALAKSTSTLGSAFGYIRNRIIYALSLGALTSFVKNLYEIRGQYELLERSLGVLINSFEKGSHIFRELGDMALKSPFTLMELAGAAKQLTAYNFAENEVVDTTRRLADLSAALGVPMERLTYNLGQIRAQTVLTARDARDFANAGLPIVKSLADHFSELEGRVVSTGDVYDRMSKKMVSYNDVMAVLMKMTDEGGKFFDFQAKQAKTLRVQMANLTLAFNNMLNEVGASNQGLLSAPLQLLKSMLQNWRALDKVIKDVAGTFLLLKIGQAVLLLIKGELMSVTGWTKLLGESITNLAIKLGKSIVSLITNPMNLIPLAIFAVSDFLLTLKQNADRVREFNAAIRDSAKEAADALEKFTSNKGNKAMREMAERGELSGEEGEKAWESISEQIRTSSMSAESLLGQLNGISNVSERVAKAFEFADKIQQADYYLQQLDNDTIKLSQDGALWGLLGGEGLVSDLKDFYKALGDKNGFASWQHQQEEFQDELDETAKSVKNFLDANNITDPLQIREILEKVRSQIKLKNPEIQGDLERLFDIEFDTAFADRMQIPVDKNYSLMRMFMKDLKNLYGHTFQDINEDVYKNTWEINEQQKEAVDKLLVDWKDKVVPEAYEELKRMVADANLLRINIGVTFNPQTLNELQKEVSERIKMSSRPLGFFGKSYLLPQQNETKLITWVERLQGIIKKNDEEIEKYKRDNTEWSQEHIDTLQEESQAAKNLLDLFNQQYAKDKSGKGNKKQDELLETLKMTVDVVKKLQSEYDTLTKKGATSKDALDSVWGRFGKTLKHINAELESFGLPKIDAKIIKGNDPNDVLKFFQELSNILTDKGLSNLERQKTLEVVIQEFSIKAQTYNLDKITKGLNSELDKLKNEYELGVELDATPELGDIFADMIGIDKEKLDELPHDFEGVMSRLQDIIDDTVGKGVFNLSKNLSKATFNEWLKANRHGTPDEDSFSKMLNTIREYANKTRLEETKKQIQEWDKLLEKYAEYEYKKSQIQKEYERELETARKRNAGKDITNAIEQQYKQKLAELDFEEFQKSPEWITATGDLANMTDSAIEGLINTLIRYKKEAKNLDPKQIKKINQALKSLYRAQRQGNPFALLANSMEEAKERASDFQPEIDKTERELEDLRKQMSLGGTNTNELAAKYLTLTERLKQLRRTQKEVGKVSAKSVVEGLQAAVAVAKEATSMFTDLADAMGGKNMTKASETVKTTMEVVDKALSGAAAGAAFGGWGAAIGGVVGAMSAIITKFADKWSGNAGITKQVEKSERAVRSLQSAMIDLEHAVDQAYGATVLGAQRAVLVNKQLQLEELQRQLELEESRKAKNRDDDKITDLQQQIKELKYEIQDGITDITNSLLGISSVGDAMESLMDGFIDALRNGEDAMSVFNDDIDKMIANMVTKMFTTKILQPWFEQQWATIQAQMEARGQQERERLQGLLDERMRTEVSNGQYWIKGNEVTKDEYLAYLDQLIAESEKNLEALSQPTMDDIRRYAELLRSGQPVVEENMQEIENFLRELGLIKDKTSDKELSALQQGIQGITEETAGALEAYMNSVAKQTYLHSDLLTQIRDAVVGLDFDVQVATQAQMLLQLQQSYMVQMAIQGILEGALTPSGRGFNVSLIN